VSEKEGRGRGWGVRAGCLSPLCCGEERRARARADRQRGAVRGRGGVRRKGE